MGTKASTSIEEDPGKEWHDLEMGARRSLDRFARVKLILDARSRVHWFQPGRDNHVRNNNGYHDAYATAIARIVPSNDARVARTFSRPIAIVH